MRQFIADGWPFRLCRVVMTLVPPLAVCIWMTCELWHRPVPTDWRSQICFGIGLLAWLGAGWFGSIFTAWLILGGMYYRQGFKNGAPYEMGDYVRILTGPHRGRVVRVDGQDRDWGAGMVRVVLGPREREQYLDWLPFYQVCREPSPKQ